MRCRLAEMMRLTSAVATIFGVGRLPWAPGTWGSVIGLALGVGVAQVVSRPAAWLLLAAALIGAVFACGRAEQQLGRHDPPVVILDEAWAMAAVIITLPWLTYSWRFMLCAFVLFRTFDIIKPPPLRRLARLPGGWGIMADDLGAAAYTTLILWLALNLWMR